MKVALRLAMLMIALRIGSAQSAGSIEGVVVDSVTGAPIKKATVYIGPVSAGGIPTDGEGKFLFVDLAPGRYGVYTHKSGYQQFDGKPGSGFAKQICEL